ncbi:MAG: glycosyltransferase family 2 protein [Chromatiales bacterium]
MITSIPSLQIICPVYNEQEVIEQFFQALKKVLQSLENRYSWRVLFVMDRSSDETLNILKNLAQQDDRVQVLALSNRFGHQMSLVAGIDHTDSDAVIMMDSDLQHPPELIPELLDAYEAGNDVVYTIRNEPRDKSALKRFGSTNFYRLMNWLAEVPLAPGEADYRLISRRVAEVFKNNIRERNQFLRGLFSWVGFNRHGIHYDPADRAQGVSKYNWSRMIGFASAGIVSFSKKPLQYAIILGLVFAAFGLVSGVVAFISFFVSDQIPSGWTTLSILISVFGGIQLFFLGVIGEYIGAIFDEVKARPLYLVEERINID